MLSKSPRLLNKPCLSPRFSPVKPRQLIIRKSFDITSLESLEFTSYLIGKSIITFTMLYCGLNYLHYKSINDKNDKDKN